mgnify:CR=1 FL=1
MPVEGCDRCYALYELATYLFLFIPHRMKQEDVPIMEFNSKLFHTDYDDYCDEVAKRIQSLSDRDEEMENKFGIN